MRCKIRRNCGGGRIGGERLGKLDSLVIALVAVVGRVTSMSRAIDCGIWSQRLDGSESSR